MEDEERGCSGWSGWGAQHGQRPRSHGHQDADGDRRSPSQIGGVQLDPPVRRAADSPPSILICIPWREHLVNPMLRRPWIVETDPERADFIIATERSRCADNQSVVLIDEVKRFDRTFAWVYARRADAGHSRLALSFAHE